MVNGRAEPFAIEGIPGIPGMAGAAAAGASVQAAVPNGVFTGAVTDVGGATQPCGTDN